MRKVLVYFLCVFCSLQGFSQSSINLFVDNTIPVTWLGIDFSNIKLIGDFSQFNGAGEQSYEEMKNDYFPGWNKLILNEPAKFDIGGMLRLVNLTNNIELLSKKNADTDISKMQAYNNPNYTYDSIVSFVEKYNTTGMSGVGICFVAEAFNKINEEAYLHFVALNLETKEILVHERLRGIPGGIGLRNYWAGSIYSIIKDINKKYYKVWKSKYL